MKTKTPTLRQKVTVYEDLLHALHSCSYSLNGPERAQELLKRISEWSYAHRRGNGELSPKEQQELINKAFWKLE